MTKELRRCIGSARYGIEPHEAPVADFPKQPSQKDGLGRMCKTHWNQYTAGLARDAKARKAAAGEAPAAEAPKATKAAKPEAKTSKRAKAAKPVVDATEAQRAEIAELERKLAEAGGVGTDAGQALLEEAAKRASSLRARAPRSVEPVEVEEVPAAA